MGSKRVIFDPIQKPTQEKKEPMADLDMTKTQALAALKRARTTMANVREKSRVPIARSVNGALTAGAGWGVGVMRSRYGEGADKRVLIPGLDMDADLVIGGGLLIAGVAGLGDKFSDAMVAMGGGTLAGHLAIEAFNDDA